VPVSVHSRTANIFLINNAAVTACPYSKTVDGLETQFATNRIGHFLFTDLLMSKLLAAAPGSRVVNVSSYGNVFSGIRFEDPGFSDGEKYDPAEAYGQSKSANVLMTMSLNEKLGIKRITAFALHPGSQ
jgi:NAD(P)-dependent dehydrogenase (short-subunit alcohol dehydrogenase family)